MTDLERPHAELRAALSLAGDVHLPRMSRATGAPPGTAGQPHLRMRLKRAGSCGRGGQSSREGRWIANGGGAGWRRTPAPSARPAAAGQLRPRMRHTRRYRASAASGTAGSAPGAAGAVGAAPNGTRRRGPVKGERRCTTRCGRPANATPRGRARAGAAAMQGGRALGRGRRRG
jgi:hypothetical protein